MGKVFALDFGGNEVDRANWAGEAFDLVAVAINKKDCVRISYKDIHRVNVPQ
jgi:hypothetical protein